MIDDGLLLGRGVHFPPMINGEGRWAFSSGAENIRQSIRIILQTQPLERLMLPEFGAGLKRMLFEPNSAATHKLIEETIDQALRRWEPRITLESVDVENDTENSQTAVVTIRYTLVATKKPEQMQLRVLLND